jgi:diguanylate cyclase (GGDEF)-like protein/PAS domain S-box-containing protein
MNSDNRSEIEELLHFLYLAPVGIVKFFRDGAIGLINPSASELMLKVAPESRLENIYDVFKLGVPELKSLVEDFKKSAGKILDGHRLDCSTDLEEMIISLMITRVSETAYMAVIADATLADQRERAVFHQREKIRTIINSLHDYAIYTLSSDGEISDWNPGSQFHTGWSEAETRGATLDMFFSEDDPERPNRHELLAQARRLGSVEIEGWQIRRDGSRAWTNTIIRALRDSAGQVESYAVISRDMTARKMGEDEALHHASIDALTGAANRRQGALTLTGALDRRARDGMPLALLMLDLDRFKSINDRHGHAGGDAVLRTLVATAKSVLRAIDTLARWGGEEFIVILPNTDTASALVAAERLRGALAGAQTTLANGGTIWFTVSIGVAGATDTDEDELLRRADTALYAAKASGRNRVVASG